MKETTINIKGEGFRVWEDGVGPKVGFLAGFGGLLQWPLFLKTLAKTKTVIVPSLPGFPGGGVWGSGGNCPVVPYSPNWGKWVRGGG